MKILIAIIIGALIGWITNFVAIKMLFRPYKEINLGIFKIQGLIPKRKNQIGEGIAETVEQELISIKDVVSHLNGDEINDKLEELIMEILDRDLKAKIVEAFPLAKMFLSDKIIDEIKGTIKDMVLENKEVVLGFFSDYIEEKVNFAEIIKTKVSEFSLEKIEEIVFSLAKKELKHIEIVGAVLGALIGLLQYVAFVFIK